MYTFFYAPKWKLVLIDAIESSSDTPHACSLKRLSVTRWTSKYDAINDFIELLSYVYEALETICSWNDLTASDANMLLNVMDFEFFVSLFEVEEMFGYGLPLNKLYQKESPDQKECVLSAECTIEELKLLREQSDFKFKETYTKAKAVAGSFGVQEARKRVVSVQRNRTNIVTDLIKDYYRISIFDSYVEYFTNQLKEQFVNHKQVFCSFMCLFESNDSERKLYDSLTQSNAPFVKINSYPELQLWKNRMAKETLTSKSGFQALLKCDKEVFPNVYKLLKISK